jgi:hypothetical protein
VSFSRDGLTATRKLVDAARRHAHLELTMTVSVPGPHGRSLHTDIAIAVR